MRDVRSNLLFQTRGLDKKIEYQLSLSKTRNPDFVIRHPNETKEKNPAGWKVDIVKRVKKEEELRQNLLSARLKKKTSYRRMNKNE